MKLDKEIIRGSTVLLIGFGAYNLLHFLFQFFMARYLTVSEYSILASVFVIVYISSVFSESIQNFMVKYTSRESETGKLKNLIARISRKMRRVSLIIIGVYLVAIIGLSKLLKIDYWLLSLGGIIIVFALFIPITRGLMQGRKKFRSLSINMMSEAFVKLIIGTGLVLLGFGVLGALIGVISASIMSFAFSKIQLKEIYSAEEKRIETKESYAYIVPTFVLTAVVVIFYSLDVWIARIFFSPEVSGAYALASLLGKIIFWGTIPISKAMMPLSTDTDKEKTKHVFPTAIALILLAVSMALLVFWIFPEWIIKIFSGKDVAIASSILVYEGISFGIIAIANLILIYHLAINKTKKYWIMVIPLILEIGILSFFRSDIFVFAKSFLIVSVIFLASALLLMLSNRSKETA
ncbi:MAG: oligosaccharide flippase family protein [Candidatus Pacearchaeota archaeon]